jgi:stage II sporulation protein D
LSPLPAVLLALLSAKPAPKSTVSVRILEREHLQSAELAGPRRAAVAVKSGRLLVDGAPAASLELPSATWTVILPGRSTRTFEGAPAVRAVRGELAIVVSMPVEAYVADAVASEMTAGAPPEALKAQAIVSRSYALAGPRRHLDADLCDLAHCQALGLLTSEEHRRAARAAAEATAGKVMLLLKDGSIARTPFHAECGGHTASVGEIFGGPDRTGAASVPDRGCLGRWEAAVSEADFQAATKRVFGRPVSARELHLERGKGGFVARVVARSMGRAVSGDALARALDAELGWGQVRSGRFSMEILPDGGVRVRGSGIGHGVGLCQAGAVRMAREGKSAEEILGRYFAGARVGTR